MQTPHYLSSGDRVAIVSTARKITETELKPALEFLKSWGLKAVLGNTIGAEDHQFAGSDELRASDFQKALDDPSIKAIWCARGGYGTVRILDRLDFSAFRKHPKWIIGYSDVTVLHSHIHKLEIETLHAQMPLDIDAKSEAARNSIRQVLFGDAYRISYASEASLSRPGKSKGHLVGGNLSILYSLCGSSSALETRGKILFLEDLDEYLYHIDRMLQNLKRNGMLEHLVGLIVGGMSKMNDNSVPFGKTAEEIIREAVSEYDYPVCFNFPAGHITDNRALILGREVTFEVSPKQVLLQFL
ncbi:LD-carboxypeptidase [Altibacter sp.]|uniref:S66 peptidase family protein n=1 Tax=Altibacter sp. TaxID=2024823 RepID=UPI000C948B7B|nr:LD-carboxypeptidase [Altibacter sp.]MAP55805.1 LD-carboxypeptidase [Altibacter sp.]